MNMIHSSHQGHDSAPLPFVVGVTGHRDLRPDDGPNLEKAVQKAFERIRKECPDTPLVLLSSLAEGADRLVAHFALRGMPAGGRAADAAAGDGLNFDHGFVLDVAGGDDRLERGGGDRTIEPASDFALARGVVAVWNRFHSKSPSGIWHETWAGQSNVP